MVLLVKLHWVEGVMFLVFWMRDESIYHIYIYLVKKGLDMTIHIA